MLVQSPGGNPYEDVNNSPTNGIDPSGLCPADVPDGTNPGRTRPSLPGGTLTLTEDQLAYTRLATQQYEARRREFLRSGGHTIGPAINVSGGSVLWAYTGGLVLNTASNMSSEFDHGVNSIANGDAGRALGNRAVAIVENQSGHAFTGTAGQWGSAAWQAGMEMSGINGMAEGIEGHDMATSQQLSASDRVGRFAGGLSSYAGLASMGVGTASKFFPRAIPMPPAGPLARALSRAIPAPVRDFLNTDLGNLVRGGSAAESELSGELCTAENGGCFLAGTLVATESGHKPIETVRAEDRVWAFDLVTGEWRLCRVVETYETDYIGEKIRIRVAGEWIDSTRHHPVWVVEGKNLEERPRPEHVRQAETADATIPGRWVDAGDVQPGDVLLLKPDRRAKVETREASDSSPRKFIISKSRACTTTPSAWAACWFITMRRVRSARPASARRCIRVLRMHCSSKREPSPETGRCEQSRDRPGPTPSMLEIPDEILASHMQN